MPQIKNKKFIDELDFRLIQNEVGRCFKVFVQTVASGDDYGQPTYTEDSGTEYFGIIQDVDTRDIQNEPGILEIGDKWLFTRDNVTIAVTDRIEIDSKRYRSVERTGETVDSPTAVFKAYVIRRVI